jgi:Lar family restriction alleviation protein
VNRSDELLPCPFCGSDEAEISYYARGSTPDIAGYFVECGSCSASGEGFDLQGEAPDREDYTKAKAIAAWNTRSQSPPAADQVRAAAADLLAAVDAAATVKRGDFYHERKALRAALATLPEEPARPNEAVLREDWAAKAALNTSQACGYVMPPDGGRSADGRGTDHAFWMLAEVAYARATGRKAHRWLGYAQAILVECGSLTLEQAKLANKRASDEAALSPTPQDGGLPDREAGWLPIETAPTDTRIIVYIPAGVWSGVRQGFLASRAYAPEWIIEGSYRSKGARRPTHWMPLPSQPINADEKGAGK